MAGTTLSSQSIASVADDTPLLTFALARKISVFLSASGFRILRLPTFIIATIILLTPLPAKAVYAYYGDSKYIFVDGLAWEEAEANSVILGGHLVTIDDQAENDWITTNLIGLDEYWIGLSDIDLNNEWIWSSGSTSQFRNWHPGEPNGNNSTWREVYGVIRGDWAGQWNDWRATISKGGIAEIKLGTGTPAGTSVPGPLPILGLGVAFGFSRQIRKRIKGHREASSVTTSLGA